MEIIEIKYDRPCWKYFWIKNVTGIDLTVHCAKSLIGDYLKERPQKIDSKFLYVCGVAFPFNYNNNFHAAFMHKPGNSSLVDEKGVRILIRDAERIQIIPMNKGDGLMPYGNRKEYYSCRNWQFANQIADKYGV